MREQYNRFKVLSRYSMDVMEFFSISTRAKGWVVTFLKMFYRYWTDFSTRKLTSRDRRFTMGAALMGWLYKHVFARKIEVRLDTKLDELIVADRKVTGVKVSHFGRSYEINARHGVVLVRRRFRMEPGAARSLLSRAGPDASQQHARRCQSRRGVDRGHEDRRRDRTHRVGLVDSDHAFADGVGCPTSKKSIRRHSMWAGRIVSASIATACASSMKRAATTTSARPWSRIN